MISTLVAAPAAGALPGPAACDCIGTARPPADDSAGGQFEDVRRVVGH